MNEQNVSTIFGAQVKKSAWLSESVTKIHLIPQHMPRKCFQPDSSVVTGILHFGTQLSKGDSLVSNPQIISILRKLVSSHGDPRLTLVFTFSAKKYQPTRGLLFSCTIKPSELLNSSLGFELKRELEKYSGKTNSSPHSSSSH